MSVEALTARVRALEEENERLTQQLAHARSLLLAGHGGASRVVRPGGVRAHRAAYQRCGVAHR
jgi:hypothetical protein